MRTILIILFAFVVLIDASGQTSTNWSYRIIVHKKYPLSYWISSCSSPINILVIDGKKFEHVRGMGKCCIELTNINSVIFVTDEKDYSVSYHIFNMNTDADIVIHDDASDFGRTIGSPVPRDSVGLSRDGKVVLCNVDDDVKNSNLSSKVSKIKSLYYLDLEKKAVVARETFYYNSSGKLLGEGTWPK